MQSLQLLFDNSAEWRVPARTVF